MDITENLSFYCKCCDHSWNRKYDFEQHMKTKKHTKNTINIPKNPTKREKTIIKNFHCDCCQFTCTTKKNARQHIINNHKNVIGFTMKNTHTCVKCNKCYDKYVSCWKHSNTCTGKKENNVVENTVITTESPMNYHCETCNFHTSIKMKFKIHCLSYKHVINCQKGKTNIVIESTSIPTEVPTEVQTNSQIKKEKNKKKLIPLTLHLFSFKTPIF